MKVLPLEETTLTVPEVVEFVSEGPVILTRNGQPEKGGIRLEDVRRELGLDDNSRPSSPE